MEFPAGGAAEGEDLAYAVGVARAVVALSVLHGDDAHKLRVQTGLLLDLLKRVLAHGHIHVAPPAGQCPAPVRLAHEENAPVVGEYGGAGVDLRGLIPGLAAEEVLHRADGYRAFETEHFRGNLAYAREALNIKAVAAVIQPRLCERLQLYRPVQPFFAHVHRFILLICKYLPAAAGRYGRFYSYISTAARRRGRCRRA